MAESPGHPIDRFLGEGAGEGGPFAVLGLDPSTASEDSIIRARSDRMRLIETHPLANTPEADEARLALVAAAAQLMSPSVRASFSGTRRTPEGDQTSSTTAALEHDTLLMIGLCGGWNELSRRRTVMLGHARGATNDEIAAALRSISMRPAGAVEQRPVSHPLTAHPPPPEQRQPAPSHDSPDEDEIDPAQRMLEQAILLSGVGLIALLAVILTGWWLVRASTPAPKSQDPQSQIAQRPAIPAEQGADSPVPGASAATSSAYHEATALLARAGRLAEETPYESARAFGSGVDLVSEAWPRFSQEQLEALLETTADYFNDLPRVPGLHRVVMTRATGGTASIGVPVASLSPGSIPSAAWGSGLLSFLIERDSIRADIAAEARRILYNNREISRANPSGFDQGVAAGLRVMLPALHDPQTSDQHWSAWADAATALGRRNTPLMVDLVLDSISMSFEVQSQTDHAERVAGLIPWGASDAAKRWLLASLADRDISSPAISVLTRAALRPGETLPPSASIQERLTLRESLTDRWALRRSIISSSLAADLLAAMREARSRVSRAADPIERLHHSVGLVLVGVAAEEASRGDEQAARAALQRFESRPPPPRRLPTPADPLTPPGSRDGVWAMSYSSTRDINIKRELIREITLRAPDQLGPIDAEILLAQAISGPNPTLRRAALNASLRFASTPALVNAILEGVREFGRSPQELNLLEVTTGRPAPSARLDAEAWSSRAQAQLTRALIERLAERSRWSSAELISSDLADAHALAMHDPIASARSAPSAVSARAERWTRLAGSARWSSFLDEARSGWIGIAVTDPQRYLAELDSARIVLHAMTVSSQPQLGQSLAELGRAHTDAVANARHIFDQIALTEHTIASLWMLRAGVGP